jgi:AcrR family transcriptional regulator
MYASKKAQSSARMRQALQQAGRELFEVRGFNHASAEEIVAKAGVTRGALYHHYEGKQGLFEAVVEETMRRLHAKIVQSASAAPDASSALRLGAHRFLALATAPRLQQVLFVDAPTVMGWQRWRQMDERFGLGLLKQAVGRAQAGGQYRHGTADVVARILLSTLIEAAMLVAHADNKTVARDDAQAVVDRILDALA